ncbi:hypothetical protein CcCBS67573_g07353 [Chytriomyces confervae]|uniref:Uncharacterized protein n=1 Tax=Chytriomyces confervae TaxID=246404 RepID=A0A507EX73_9FUNG|nr:hypothetical protein CcCBS67573_g07353 [Chytriomyces confervae]
MQRDEVMDWFQRKLNRAPEAADIYKVAKEFYQLGAYSRALLCLQQYITMPNSTLPGRHLLAYCHLNLGEVEKALQQFKKCVKDGYFEDWQLVVELTIEMEDKRRMEDERVFGTVLVE